MDRDDKMSLDSSLTTGGSGSKRINTHSRLGRSNNISHTLIARQTESNARGFQSKICNNMSLISGLTLNSKLYGHSGCVNTIDFSPSGEFIITGSDDCHVNIYSQKYVSTSSSSSSIQSKPQDDEDDDLPTQPPTPTHSGIQWSIRDSIETGHSRNIFCTRFVPGSNDSKFVSCGMDGEIRVTDITKLPRVSPNSTTSTSSSTHHLFRRHPSFHSGVSSRSAEPGETLLYSSDSNSMALKLVFYDYNTFLSTHEDGYVRLFDLRKPTPCSLLSISHSDFSSRSTPESPTAGESSGEGSGNNSAGGAADASAGRGPFLFRRGLGGSGGGDKISINTIAMEPIYCTPSDPIPGDTTYFNHGTQFIIGGGDPFIRLYDLKKLSISTEGNNSTSTNTSTTRGGAVYVYCPEHLLKENRPAAGNLFLSTLNPSISVTGVDWILTEQSQSLIAATYSKEHVYTFLSNIHCRNPTTPDFSLVTNINATLPNCPTQNNYRKGFEYRFEGHRNVRTFLKEVCILRGGSAVATGSDEGGLWIWHRSKHFNFKSKQDSEIESEENDKSKEGKEEEEKGDKKEKERIERDKRLVGVWRGDKSVLNGVRENRVGGGGEIGTCGIDSEGKVFGLYGGGAGRVSELEEREMINKNKKKESGRSATEGGGAELRNWMYLMQFLEYLRRGGDEDEEEGEEEGGEEEAAGEGEEEDEEEGN
eukprot:TRINITY_DN3179_c4_g1_i1.p1 TRINITY_DN3179_c4_g1~~TRINITY_DN3179_c4_g1_i1.p1  ORF type:complete len:703 (-),score=204.95 TRINITY_DN3179_c4_g1_i1:52-2160(-)